MSKILTFEQYTLNEELSIKEIWNKAAEKAKDLPKISRQTLLRNALFSLLTFGSVTSVIQYIQNSNADEEVKKEAIEQVEEMNKFTNGSLFTLSQTGWDHIKNEEKLKLKAYNLGDGMVTVGYGHAERIGKTKLKPGQKISEEQAKKLLKEDLTTAADGVRRIFKEWNEKGTDVKITQSMFDALVSIAYNAGVSGLKFSPIMKYLKEEDYKNASESILGFKISKKFPGLKVRRQKEYDLFVAGL
jgi:GH24 family phage-related lysozyme (muramidase)